ncbi:MAG: dTMP kinase [Phycisphaerales bacterium]|nr:dTMP kinase [Phycisphaerales bacterium]
MNATLSALHVAGKFIVLDGIDGCGKSTQLHMLQTILEQLGAAILCVREPGGTAIGEHIRELLLSSKGEGLNMRAEMLLYMASRAQLVGEKIRPALAAGHTVLSDRYVSSTLAYQGSAGGLPIDNIMHVAQAAIDGTWPDLTIILDLPLEKAMTRLQSPGKSAKKKQPPQPGLFQDRIEQRQQNYHELVRQGFLQQAKNYPDHYKVVSAIGTPDAVFQRVQAAVCEYFTAA